MNEPIKKAQIYELPYASTPQTQMCNLSIELQNEVDYRRRGRYAQHQGSQDMGCHRRNCLTYAKWRVTFCCDHEDQQ